jgi:signal transduction histidine kinase/streptogramin lyase
MANNTHTIDTVLREEDIMQILPDSEGNTWLATYGNGLYKYFAQDFNRCSSRNMRTVMSILKEEDGTSWIGTGNKGIRKMYKGKVTAYMDAAEEYRNTIVDIKKSPAGVVWAATSYGLGRYNKDRDAFDWFTSNEGLSSSSISSLEFDEKGNLWIGTYSGGINYYNGKSFTSYSVKQGLTSANVLATHYLKSSRTLFIGSEFGLARLQDGAVAQEPLPEIENTSVLSINSFRDSLLLVGTAGSGVMVYDPTTKVRSRITSKEGLASDFIYFAAADAQGHIWIGTEKGISRIALSAQLDIENNLHYDHDNGLEGIEANQNSFFLGNNEKYFGMIDGLYDFTESNPDDIHSFPLHLTGVNLMFGQKGLQTYAKSVDGFFKIPVGLSLPPDQNHITFTFNRVDKRYPKAVKFKYRLVNYDKTWSLPSAQKEVTYSNLPPGHYVFEVHATDNRGSWASAPTRFAFVINAPFYQTAGFIGSMVVLALGALLLFLYLRVRHKVNHAMEVERIRTREQEMLRKEIARDFHDEMGNQLSRIINYVSLLRLNGSSGMSQNDLFAKVEGSAKYLYSGTRDFIWSIDPVNDELSKLFIHLRDFGEKLFEEKSIHFRAYNEVREKITLPYGFSRQANLIFKEVMTNAFKYSEASNVQLVLRREGEAFRLIFKDDGIGFLINEVMASNGLQNMHDRSNRINSRLLIHSQRQGTTQPGGTTITLEFKNTKTKKHGLTI